MRNIRVFLSEFFSVLEVNFSIYLNRCFIIFASSYCLGFSVYIKEGNKNTRVLIKSLRPGVSLTTAILMQFDFCLQNTTSILGSV